MTRKTAKQRRSKACRNTKHRQAPILENAAETASENSMLGVIERSVLRSGLTYENFVKHLTQTAFANLYVWSESDLNRLLLSAERLGLDPLNGEIYAAQSSDDPMSPILIVVSVNGWARILNTNMFFDGVHFSESTEMTDGIPDWIACTIHRKDRSIATTVREYFCEVKGEQGAWLTHPRRMLRHKAMVQCARICFSLIGIYDDDEASRIRTARSTNASQTSTTQNMHKSLRKRLQPSSSAAVKSAIRRL
jgi:RecT family